MDSAAFRIQLASAALALRAKLRSECQHGAYNFLAATPSHNLDLAMPAASFYTALELRLGQSVTSGDDWYPLCDAVLDASGFHADACSAASQQAPQLRFQSSERGRPQPYTGESQPSHTLAT